MRQLTLLLLILLLSACSRTPTPVEFSVSFSPETLVFKQGQDSLLEITVDVKAIAGGGESLNFDYLLASPGFSYNAINFESFESEDSWACASLNSGQAYPVFCKYKGKRTSNFTTKVSLTLKGDSQFISGTFDCETCGMLFHFSAADCVPSWSSSPKCEIQYEEYTIPISLVE